MILWDKGKKTDLNILNFTVGNDRKLDMDLATSDVIASIAHVLMLEEVKLLTKDEKNNLVNELTNLFYEIRSGVFKIEEDIEDIHSQVEQILTNKLGETGKRVHTARSRNDQILVDLKLFYRQKTAIMAGAVKNLIMVLIEQGQKNKAAIIPGYTHFQAAIPSSFVLWFGAYAESLVEDLMIHEGIIHYINQNPLGSAAGYGSSFPIDRDMTTRLLEFNDLHINSINAQLSRGKTEKLVSVGLASIAGSLSKMAMDMTLFMSQNFGFINLKDDLTTGSSIMPHKKNPDVLEIIRAKCNRICAVYNEVLLLTQNLPSGYHRDFQLLKEIVFPAYHELSVCLEMMIYVVNNLEISKNITDDEKYLYIFSVENVNEKVMKGIPFREAYTQVVREIEEGKFKRISDISYTHTGSIGNPGFERIINKLDGVWHRLEIDKFISFEERFINKVKGS
jgi:argininosuccinate lyase